MPAATPHSAQVSASAAALILSFEGMDQPSHWPGGSSGITLGHGFDLGYATRAEFAEAWERYLMPAHFQKLLGALGKTGSAASSVRSRFAGITLTVAEADEVFWRCTMPRWCRLTAQAFPGLDVLTPAQQGALVSLCFNRGTALAGDRRREMAQIAKILRQPTPSPQSKALLIADQIEAMQRLWPSTLKSSPDAGLRRRRRAEAALMRSGV